MPSCLGIHSIKIISEDEAISALQDTNQTNVQCEKTIRAITLVEDHTRVEWDDKKDDIRILKAIIFKLDDKELAFQGDYTIPLIDVFKGDNTKEKLKIPGDEFADDPETIFISDKFFVKL